MAYSKTHWNDGAPPAISAANLNKIEDGIENNDTWNATQDGRISAVEGRATTLEENVTSLEGRATSLEGRATALEGSVTSLEGRVDAQDAKIATLEIDVKDILPTDTASGEIASFPDGSDLFDYLSCIVDIEPLQDLHGYDSPWVGGAGKNKLPYPYLNASGTSNGITRTVNSDGSVTFNGTATANSWFNFCLEASQIDWPAGSYTANVNGGESNPLVSGVSVTMNVRVGTSNKYDATLNDSTQSVSFTPPEDGYLRCYVQIDSGVTVNNMVIKPMIRLAAESDATYEPYENLCPITGWTGCEVNVSGVNIWDEDWEVGSISGQTGQSISGSYVRSTNYISVKPNTIYYFNRPAGNKFWLYAYDENKNYMHDAFGTTTGYYTLGETTYLFTIPNGVYYIRFVVDNNYGTTYNNDISINYPSTDHDYHSHNGTTYPVSWQTEAGTIYGGKLDLVTGVLTVDRRHVVLDGVTNKVTGSYGNSAQRLIGFVISDQPATGTSVESLLCGNLKVSGNILTDENAIALGDGNSKIIPHIEGMQGIGGTYADNTALANAINTYLQSNPAECVYRLATPTTYQLDPVQVACLLGQNNVFANCGNIEEVQYKADVQKWVEKKLGE